MGSHVFVTKGIIFLTLFNDLVFMVDPYGTSF